MKIDEIISLVRSHFADFDESDALTYAQQTHTELLRLVRIKDDDDVTLSSLVAGTYKYSISTDIVRIWAATYYTSATDYRELRPRSLDEMDDQEPLWRQAANAPPIYYDERAGYLYLFPTPDTSTSSGYPKVVLHCQKTETLTRTTTLQNTVPGYDAWIYGIAMRYAIAKSREDADYFKGLYEEAKAKLVGYSQGKTTRLKPNYRPRIPSPGRS